MPKPKTGLRSLMNVGKAVLRDLNALGIEHISQLKQETADGLYKKLEAISGKKQDPCVLDVFSAIIHEAKTGEKLPWWHWSAIRKGRLHKY